MTEKDYPKTPDGATNTAILLTSAVVDAILHKSITTKEVKEKCDLFGYAIFKELMVCYFNENAIIDSTRWSNFLERIFLVCDVNAKNIRKLSSKNMIHMFRHLDT